MNNTIFYFFYNFAHQSNILDNLIIFCGVYLPFLTIFGAGIFLLFHHDVLSSGNPFQEFFKKWREILLVFLSGILAWFSVFVLKLFFETLRPYQILPNITPLFSPTDHSFPSGHATFFFALAFSLFFSHKKIGYIFFIFAIIISTARIAAGVHFPLDILGGFLLGYISTLLINYINKQ